MQGQLLTVEQIANLVGDTTDNIYGFIREDRIPYVVGPDGFMIPLGGFQMCMEDLYHLSEALAEMDRRIEG